MQRVCWTGSGRRHYRRWRKVSSEEGSTGEGEGQGRTRRRRNETNPFRPAFIEPKRSKSMRRDGNRKVDLRPDRVGDVPSRRPSDAREESSKEGVAAKADEAWEAGGGTVTRSCGPAERTRARRRGRGEPDGDRAIRPTETGDEIVGWSGCGSFGRDVDRFEGRRRVRGVCLVRFRGA